MDVRELSNAIGAVFAAAGLVGFVLTGFEDVAAPHGAQLVVFSVNPLQNGLHLLLGAGLVGSAAGRPAPARRAAVVAAAAFALLGIAGIAMVKLPVLNVLAVNGAGNALHLATAVALRVALALTRGDAQEPFPAWRARG